MIVISMIIVTSVIMVISAIILKSTKLIVSTITVVSTTVNTIDIYGVNDNAFVSALLSPKCRSFWSWIYLISNAFNIVMDKRVTM